MRLWSLHPKYLDRQGLLALWREGLLARAVLHGQTKGYKNHPQLTRFYAHETPLLAIDVYLAEVVAEASARNYRFDGTKLAFSLQNAPPVQKITVTNQQLIYEFAHLKRKLELRSPEVLAKWAASEMTDVHPFLTEIEGAIESWERM